jgi:hypothetical protein
VGKVRIGMKPAEVLQLLGKPKHIGRQILYRRYLEQWVYDHPAPLWIDFECVKGQEAHVVTVHPAPAAQR